MIDNETFPPCEAQTIPSSKPSPRYVLLGIDRDSVAKYFSWAGTNQCSQQDVHFVRPGMTARVARPYVQNSIDLVLIGVDRSHQAPEYNFDPIP
jgi:hypothetical protein